MATEQPYGPVVVDIPVGGNENTADFTQGLETLDNSVVVLTSPEGGDSNYQVAQNGSCWE